MIKQKVTAIVLTKSQILALLLASSFALSFVIGGPQLLVGTLVNLFLFIGAFYLPLPLLLPLIVAPSLGVLSRGFVFGPLTIFLVYLLPFIWFGNLSLVFVFKKSLAFLGFLPAVFLASLVKFSLLYLAANFLVASDVLPNLFLTTMGLNQLVTALVGGGLALFALRGK